MSGSHRRHALDRIEYILAPPDKCGGSTGALALMCCCHYCSNVLLFWSRGSRRRRGQCQIIIDTGLHDVCQHTSLVWPWCGREATVRIKLARVAVISCISAPARADDVTSGASALIVSTLRPVPSPPPPTWEHAAASGVQTWHASFLVDVRCYDERLKYLHTHTHDRLTAFGPGQPGRPVPEETLTHSHPSWSSDILYHLPPFTAINGILFVHFTRLTVLSYNLSPGPLWSSSWSWTLDFILHTFLHTVIVIFSQHMTVPAQPVLLQHECYVIYP